jgi:molybdopterin biosynthesis enzyme MoaB
VDKAFVKNVYILPTGDEIRNGVVWDLDSPEIISQILHQYPMAEVTRLSPVVDDEDTILRKIQEIATRAPDLLVLIGGSGGGHRFSETLSRDFTHSALEHYLDERSSREIYGKNGHLWSKQVCGKIGTTLIVNVPGPYEEAKAAFAACVKTLSSGRGGLEDVCQAMAEAVYAQYPVGSANANCKVHPLPK